MPLQVKIKSPEGGTLKTANAYIENDINIVPNLQNKTITQNGSYTADEGYAGLGNINIQVAGEGGVDTSQDTVTAETILEGFTAHNAEGELITGSIQTYDGVIQNGVVQPVVKSVEFNIAYGDAAPEDVSKLWVKTAEPEEVQITPKLYPINEELNIGIGTLPSYTSAIASAVIGTKIYLFGGYPSLDTINVFDTDNNTITTLDTTLPTGTRGIAAAVIGTKVYLFGGRDKLNTINVFDTENNTITTLGTTLPVGAYTIASAVIGTKVYLFGGVNGSTRYSTINVFNTESNTITTLDTKLPDGGQGVASAVIGTKVYLFGGRGTSSYLSTINVFDTENNTITTLDTTLPSGTYGIAAAVIGTKVYLFGGTGSNSHISTINVFDTESNTITTLDIALPAKAYDIAAAVIGTKVYLFGGFTGGNLNTINVFIALTELATNSILIETSTTENTFNLLPNMLVGVRNVYVGNADGYAERAEAYLRNGTEWVQI